MRRITITALLLFAGCSTPAPEPPTSEELAAQREAIQTVDAHIEGLKQCRQLYRDHVGVEPEKLRDLFVKPDGAPDTWKRCINFMPIDPWGNDYAVDDAGDIHSLGPDGKPSTGDEIY